MVYKKYITRNGKTFGPYYYESYRDKNGNVKSRFISGPTQKDKVAMKFNNKKFMFVVYFILIVMVIIGIKLFVGEIEKDKGITGHVVDCMITECSPDEFCDSDGNKWSQPTECLFDGENPAQCVTFGEPIIIGSCDEEGS